MFGFKLITEKELERLRNLEILWESRKDVLSESEELLKRDCESLREQLNQKISQINKMKKESFNFEDFFNVIVNGSKTKKCSECENEQEDCKKITSGKYSVCILRKQ